MTKRTTAVWLLLASVWGGPALSQPAPASDRNLANQVERLRDQVAQLQAAMTRQQAGGRAAVASGGSVGPMGGVPMGQGAMPAAGAQASMMDDDAMMSGMGMGSGGMPPGSMSMGCCPMMGQMPAGGGMGMSTLPGFPGASQLYHIGETGFFLDHPEHITLSPEQASRLGKLREDAMRGRGDMERKIASAEEQLWQLTASDQPSSSAIEAKVREIEKLRGDQRLAFIRAVGDAAKLLTDDQRKALLGQLPPSPNPVTGLGQAMPQPQGSPMGGGMMMDDAMEMPPSGGGSMGSGSGGMGHM